MLWSIFKQGIALPYLVVTLLSFHIISHLYSFLGSRCLSHYSNLNVSRGVGCRMYITTTERTHGTEVPSKAMSMAA